MNITLTDADLMRLQVIEMDKDAEEALVFLRERILPQMKDKQGKAMLNHLDGGKGSML